VRHRIRHTLQAFRWQHWLVAAALVLAIGFTGLHAYRAVRAAIFWSHNQDEPIQGWMTVGFVAHSYHVPPRILYEALGLPLGRDRRPLRIIAKTQNRSLEAEKARLQTAILQARPPADQGGPPPDKGGPR
jgi:hypothetical protein